MKVISTEYSQILGARISQRLGVGLVDVKFSKFPDGELYLRTGALDEEWSLWVRLPEAMHLSSCSF